MANIYPTSASLASLPASIAARFRESMKSSALVGPDSSAVRFAKIQWIVILWRCLVLVEVAVMTAVCPSCYFPLETALLILALGIAHTLVFSWCRPRTSLTSSWPFYIADFAFSMALMILARDGALVMVLSFYATSALFVRPIARFSQAFALSGLAGISFLAALYIASPVHYSTAEIANFSLIFLFWGFGWVLICRAIERSAMLEIDLFLEEQRRGFRRRLHDDLGNTLCGLHFKIQSLFRMGRYDIREALALLEAGYDRAAQVLDRILAGIKDEDECETIVELVRMAESDFDIRVHLTGNLESVCLSPSIRQEVFSLLREAVANSAKHAGTGEVMIGLSRRRKQLKIVVSDEGAGFEAATCSLTRPVLDGGLGLNNMRERAEAIGARLTVSSRPDAGTTIILSLPENMASDNPAGRLTSRIIDSDIYLLLLRLKMATLFLEVLQLVLGGTTLWTDPAALLVIFLVAGETMAWYVFRRRLLGFITRRPWWLVLDILFFCGLYFISWRAGIPMLVAEAASMAIALSAWFLGATRNLLLAVIMGGGIILASLMAPPEASMELMRTEALFIDVMDNLIIAFLAGIVCEFIRSINSLRAGVVDIALERQRASMSIATHRSLYELVEGLKHDIGSAQSHEPQDSSEELHAPFIASLEARSTFLKQRLRSILAAIDRPESVDN